MLFDNQNPKIIHLLFVGYIAQLLFPHDILISHDIPMVISPRKLAAERDEIHRRWGEQHQRIIAEHQKKVNEMQAQFAVPWQQMLFENDL